MQHPHCAGSDRSVHVVRRIGGSTMCRHTYKRRHSEGAGRPNRAARRRGIPLLNVVTRMRLCRSAEARGTRRMHSSGAASRAKGIPRRTPLPCPKGTRDDRVLCARQHRRRHAGRAVGIRIIRNISDIAIAPFGLKCAVRRERAAATPRLMQSPWRLWQGDCMKEPGREGRVASPGDRGRRALRARWATDAKSPCGGLSSSRRRYHRGWEGSLRRRLGYR